MSMAYFLKYDVGECKVNRAFETMLFRQVIGGCQNVVCYIIFRLLSNSLLIFAAHLLTVCFSTIRPFSIKLVP